MSNSSKRVRPDPDLDWEIVLEDAQAFRLIVETAISVMARVTFKIRKRSNGAYFLCVDGADPGRSCCVSTRLQLDNVKWICDEDETSEEFTFCLDCKHVLTAVDPSSTGATLTIKGNSHDASVIFTIKDPEQPGYEPESELKTFVDPDSGFKLKTIDFQMILEIDLSRLRELLKKARKSNAELLRIQIFVMDRGSKKQSLVIFSIEGENQTHKQKFAHDIHIHEDGSMVVRAAADGECEIPDIRSMKNEFDHAFPVDKIESFVKNLPTRMIIAKVGSGNPMLLSHNLKGANDDAQHIRFLVASSISGSD